MKWLWKLALVLVVVLVLMGCEGVDPTVSPLAAPGEPHVIMAGPEYGPEDWEPGAGDPGGPKDVVRWLATGGGVVAAGWLASWLCSVWPWFNALKSEHKELVADILGVVIPFGAGAVLVNVPEAWWSAVEDAWPVVIAGAGLLVSKFRYATVVKRDKLVDAPGEAH